MTPDTITQRIHDRADRELKAKLSASTQWVWDETGHSAIRPPASAVEAINRELKGTGLPPHPDLPWIGAIQKQFEVVAFEYLKERYRRAALTEFMAKVDSVSDILNHPAE